MSETVTYLTRRCPRCGRELPPDAPENLCAFCLLAAGAETLTGSNDATSTGVASTADSSRPGPLRLVDGQLWGPYRIVRLLGRGGMGEVYEAEQLETGRRLALKVLRETLRGADDRARFLREGQLAASISHPHTVYIFGSEEIGGAPAITMELLPGGTLKDRVSTEGPMSPDKAVSAVLDIIGGLDAAQAAGILHRDIKPSNCFVDADGAVKVGDFGLSISTLTRDVKHDVTTRGFEGTPQFAAPEQLRGEPLDVRADIYAVGATLYYLLTGRPPLDAPDLHELVANVASEKPASPRALRREVPRALAAVVLRCLAKAPRERPQSYAELADLLRPYRAQGDVAAGLGVRFVAWIADSVVLAIVTWLLSVLAFTAVMRGFTNPLLQLASWPWLPGMIYFFVLEGWWGASLGKRLMGLRVVSRASTGWWRLIGLRTAVFTLPQFAYVPFLPGAPGGSVAPQVAYTNGPSSGFSWNVPPDALAALLSAVLPLLLTALLFSTARRRNGWTGVHDLLSRTRVVEHHVVRPVAAAVHRPTPAGIAHIPIPAMRIGPYVVHSTVGETGGGRLFVGIDPVLRRHAWIHQVPAGTPPADAIRQDVSRPGRAYWLAGRRSATENWDAFEAPGGEPLLTAPPTSDWRQLRRALSSLAIELEASAREGRDTRLSLAHVWTRGDGQLVLLDFPWPLSVAPEENRVLDPVELLAAVSRRAFADSAEPATPLSATTFLNRLASGAPPALADVTAALGRLASVPGRPSRLRRTLPIVMAAAPVAVLILFFVVLLPTFARTFMPEKGNLMMWMMWIVDSSPNAPFQTPEQRTAAEVYVAAHFGPELTSEAYWSTQMPGMEPFISMRRTAAEIAARHPVVSPDELARASAVLAPKLQEMADQRADLLANMPAGGGALRTAFTSGFPALAVLLSIVCSLVSVLAVAGGLITRVLGHAVVRRDGREIGRLRSVVRLLIAWSPAIVWMAYAGIPMFGEPRAISPDVLVAGSGLAALLLLAGAAWTIAVPTRGPHDRLAGTWVVPR